MAIPSPELPEELRRRIEKVTKALGISGRDFVIESLQAAVLNAERRSSSLRVAQTAYEEMCTAGEAYDADVVHRYIRARARGEEVDRPRPVYWEDLIC